MSNSRKYCLNCLSVFLFFVLVFFNVSEAQEYSSKNRVLDSMRLRYLNDQYIQSWIKSDTATYNHLLWGKDFVHLSAGTGKLIAKNELAPLFGVKRFDQIDFFYADSVTVRFIGDSVAFIYAVTPYRGKGATVVEYSRYNDVYIKDATGWKCIAANTVSIESKYFELPEISSMPSYVQKNTWSGIDGDKNTSAAEVLLLNQKWVHAFVKRDEQFLAKAGSPENWITYPDGSLEKKMQNLFKLPDLADSIFNETISFPRRDFAIVRNVLAFVTGNSKMIALQMCNYYYHCKGKWEMVSFNATAIRD